MLALTRKTDYALIALTQLAQDSTECVSARAIATRYRVPLPLLMNILKLLTQQGLAKSSRGSRGGYTLAKPATEITLNDVIEAIEGPIELVQCIDASPGEGQSDGGNPCRLLSCCPVRSPIHRIHDRLVEFLKDVTLADIVEGSISSEPALLGGRIGEQSCAIAHLPG
jgi:Rrf2 family protein